jgi:hypothetical protein
LQDRTVGTGILSQNGPTARLWSYVGRASVESSTATQCRISTYDAEFDVDAGRRCGRPNPIRSEIEQHDLDHQSANSFGPTAHPAATSATSRHEGVALVEGFRGDVLVWVRTGADGLIERCHLRDPSWFQWPVLEAAVEGNIVADFPLCNKSFNCSYSGHDL